MNPILMQAFWRERFTSPIRLLLVLTLCGFGPLFGFLQRPIRMPSADATLWPVLIFGAGVIGRPEACCADPGAARRAHGYVLSRWLVLGRRRRGVTARLVAGAAVFLATGV